MSYLAAFLIAVGLSSLAVPRVLHWARRTGRVDPTDERKLHAGDQPRLGGIGIFAGFLAGAVVALTLPQGRLLFDATLNGGRGRILLGVLIGAALMFGLGLADDLLHRSARGGDRPREGLPAWFKLVVQLVAAAIPIAAGLSVQTIRIPGDGYVRLWPWLQWLLPMLWIVGVANAINFIDGLDGLAGGVALIIAATLALLALSPVAPAPGEAMLALALLGGIVGFLRLNFPPPARIFMGDGGSLLLGYVLAAISLSGVMKTATLVAVGAPFLILALPILDLTQVVVGRVMRGSSPLAADRTHLHYRLHDAGWSPFTAVLFIYAVVGLCASSALSLAGLGPQAALLSAVVAGLLVTVAARRPGQPDATPAQPDAQPLTTTDRSAGNGPITSVEAGPDELPTARHAAA